MKEISKEEYPTEYIHPRCGGVAFYFNKEFVTPGGTIPYSWEIVLLDGEHPTPGSLRVCDTCGRELGGLFSKKPTVEKMRIGKIQTSGITYKAIGKVLDEIGFEMIRAESNIDTFGYVTYTGKSEYFDELQNGETIPFYLVTIEHKPWYVTLERIK